MTSTEAAPTAGLRLGAVNFDCADPTTLAAFWSAATGGEIVGDLGGFVMVSPPPSGGPMLYFQHVDGERPARNSAHLDFDVTPGTRDAEVERLVGLGATKQYEVIGEVEFVDWVTLRDPEGNLFCVGSAPEHAS